LGALGTIDSTTTRYLLKLQMKEHLFKTHKIVDEEDLSFSNSTESICRQLAGILTVPGSDVENCWADQKKEVLKSFNNHRNNVIKSIGLIFQGKNAWWL
jgi:hypothetical protein